MVGTTVGYHGKAVQPEVNTARPHNRLKGRRGELGDTQCVPVARGGLFDPNRLDSAVFVRVKAAYPAEFRELDTGALKGRAFGILERGAHLMAALKFGIARPFFKEVFIGAVKVFERPLQRVAVGVEKPAVFGFKFGEFRRLLHVGQALTCRFVGFLATIKPPIVNIASVRRLTYKRALLDGGEPQFNTKGFGRLVRAALLTENRVLGVAAREAHSFYYTSPKSGYRRPQFLPSAEAGGFLETFL